MSEHRWSWTSEIKLPSRKGAHIALLEDILLELERLGWSKDSRDYFGIQMALEESLSNAIRHGRAKVVRIELEKGDGLRLAVEDDGEGIGDSRESSGGFGLVSMRERAEALGGTLQVAPAAGRGTRVDVWLP